MRLVAGILLVLVVAVWSFFAGQLLTPQVIHADTPPHGICQGI